jgi:cell division protein FtsB
MEPLSMLEEKVSLLLNLVKELKKENARLDKENSDLLNKIELLESSTIDQSQQAAEEKALTKIVVEDLIKSIDSFVQKENQ